MPQMIPSRPVADCAASEVKVFEALAAGLPKDWIVIHSRRFVLPAVGSHHSAIECEVDFLILDPSRGYIGLEVKGGEVGRDLEGWYSIDRFGNHHRIKDPGSQAQRSVHFVDRYLKNSKTFAGWTPPFGWGVCFPDVVARGDLDPSLPRTLLVDQSDLLDVGARLERVFDAAGLPTGRIPDAMVRAFLTTIAPALKLAPSLAVRFDEESPMLVRLTQEQMDILDLFEEFPRVLIKGAAGTGKTMVAMEKARRMAAVGKRVILLCFNRPLAEFLAPRADGFKIDTFHGFCSEMARRADIKFREPADDKETFWNETAPDLLIQALEVYPDERYDAVVVDEGQDFKPVWWLAIEGLLSDSTNGTLYVFYDPNQTIYGGGPAENLNLKSTTLKYNCRNTKRIATYSGRCIDLVPLLKEGAPDGEAVIERSCADERDMVNAVRILLHEFVNEQRIPTEKIVILTTRAAAYSPVYRAKKLGNLKLIELHQRPNPDEVRFSTLHRFKGLEADVVILCDVRPGDDESAPMHLYVATSRAKHVLAVARYS